MCVIVVLDEARGEIEQVLSATGLACRGTQRGVDHLLVAEIGSL